MKILTGKFRGRRIVMPVGIRPTQDKVRKAIFDILGDIEELAFLELFAGSGGVGFEAASRGASEVVLVESSRTCQQVIAKNIQTLGAGNCTLYSMEAEKTLGLLHKNHKYFDIVFLDPPYDKLKSSAATPCADRNCAGVRLSAAKKTLQTLGAYDIVAPNGFVIAEHFKKDILPQAAGDLVLFKQAGYGDTKLSFYRKTLP